MTTNNGLIMYLSVLAVVRRVKGSRVLREKGLTACHSWLKANWERRKGWGVFAGLNAVNNIRECS